MHCLGPKDESGPLRRSPQSHSIRDHLESFSRAAKTFLLSCSALTSLFIKAILPSLSTTKVQRAAVIPRLSETGLPSRSFVGNTPPGRVGTPNAFATLPFSSASKVKLSL